MTERKITFLVIIVGLYCVYSVRMWLVKDPIEEKAVDVKTNHSNDAAVEEIAKEIVTETKTIKQKVFKKTMFQYSKNTCSVLDIIYKKPIKCKESIYGKTSYSESPTITVIGITIFLLVLAVNAVLDVIKVKEEERARGKENPDGYRRYSLAEFANRKTLTRDSSKFGLHLFQIAETVPEADEEKKNRRQTRITRGESTNSYLSDKKHHGDELAPFCTANDTPPGETKLLKRQSVAKLIGARPVPMVRRSSFPVLPLNPDVQAMMLQGSNDSDDEADGKGRRVRLIRRF